MVKEENCDDIITEDGILHEIQISRFELFGMSSQRIMSGHLQCFNYPQEAQKILQKLEWMKTKKIIQSFE